MSSVSLRGPGLAAAREPASVNAVFPLTRRLRFTGDLEAEFAAYHAERALPFARLALILAVVLYALFGILDVFIVPGAARWVWVIRYAIFCPAALAVLRLTFTRRFKPVMQPVLSGMAVLAGLGIVAMIAIAPPAAGYLYYAGLLLVIPWAYAVLQLRFSYATRACLAFIIGYELVAIWLKPTPVDILLNNNFFFLSAVIVGMVAGYTIERGFRIHFLQRRLIEAQRAELAVHNEQLDSALQESLGGLRRQAAELRASRAPGGGRGRLRTPPDRAQPARRRSAASHRPGHQAADGLRPGRTRLRTRPRAGEGPPRGGLPRRR